MNPLTIRYFTDPGDPLAFSAEGVRLRLLWLFGDQIAWEVVMAPMREERGSPWEPGTDATIHACRAVVGAGLRWPELAEPLLRQLRVLAMAGALLDDSDTLELAAEHAGLPVVELAAYCAEQEVEAALRAGMDGALPSPSYEIVGCATLRGLPAIEAAEAALGGLARRPRPDSASEVLRWAAMPLTTAEVATVCGRDVDADLERTARFEPLGDGGYWSV